MSAISLYAQLAKSYLTKEHDISLLKQLNVIKTVAHATDHLVSRLFVQIKSLVANKIDVSQFREAFIRKDIDEVLATYPIVGDERRLIRRVNHDSDFAYIGESTLTKYVLLNLLRNAISVIKEANKGEITIELKTDERFNQVIVTDTALGISRKILPKIFDQFKDMQRLGKGTGLGLSFCKLVMGSYGGDIIVTSKKGETKFVLNFIKIRN